MVLGVGAGVIRTLWMWRVRRGVVYRSGWRLLVGLSRLRVINDDGSNECGYECGVDVSDVVFLLFFQRFALGLGVFRWCWSVCRLLWIACIGGNMIA